MTEPKHVAQSLITLMINPNVVAILDRTSDIAPIMDEVVSWWDYDLLKRKPSPAYDDYGIFKGTDLDLACFLYALQGRGSVINIPYYKGHSKKSQRKDQKLTSSSNRNGELIGVGANKHFFSFNINVIDQNVIGEDKVGDFRTFSLTDKTGDWYDGWREIQFVPTMKENKFITENKLWSGNKIIFKNFIHPNRWTSFFGHHYIITKLLIERLEEEAKFLNREIKTLLAEGIKFPSSEGPKSHEYDYGKSVSQIFTAFEVKIHIPVRKRTGEYSPLDRTQGTLIWAYNRRKYYNKAISSLRFMTRASEYAHHKNPDRMPAWLKNIEWEPDFIEPGKRTRWNRLKLFQPAVGEHSVSILKRSYEKSAQVGAD